MARLKKTKQTKLRQLLNEARANPLPLPKPVVRMEDTLDSEKIRRLKPLAWLIETQQYTLEETMTTALVYEERKKRAKRAEEILQLIKSRQQKRNGK
jgi:hypothetical protein